ncbi:MAG TPA: hypothetical protein VMR98_02385, partial [Candidatus Polarisedimenticolaceae bacterium]|nr:hypothetical protein [Candidatus Polarisedimenticolaceae bacterium]
AARIVDVMGGLLGTWLRKQMGIHQPSGGVQLIGGMGKGTALYADPKLSPFMERLHMGLRHAELVDTYQIAVNRDETLHDRGGRILAERVGR